MTKKNEFNYPIGKLNNAHVLVYVGLTVVIPAMWGFYKIVNKMIDNNYNFNTHIDLKKMCFSMQASK